MSRDGEQSAKLESEASRLIDQADTDEQQLDKAAELLAQAEKLKGPIVDKDKQPHQKNKGVK